VTLQFEKPCIGLRINPDDDTAALNNKRINTDTTKYLIAVLISDVKSENVNLPVWNHEVFCLE
jgi:hypothetical protein